MPRTFTRAKLLTALLVVAAPIWIVGQTPQSNFVGGTPASVDATAVRTTRLKFPKGSRSNWHSHATGQLLMVQEGRALTQDRGGAVREVQPNQPWWTAAGVEHWHGAAQDVDLVQLTIYEGAVKWLEPVTDAQYKATPKK